MGDEDRSTDRWAFVTLDRDDIPADARRPSARAGSRGTRWPRLPWQAAVLGSTTVGIVVLDLDGRIRLANEQAARITGHSVERLLTMSATDLKPAGEVEAFWARLHAIASGDAPSVSGEFLYSRADGQPLWMNVSVSPVVDGAGAVTSVLCLLVDVTAEREARQALGASEQGGSATCWRMPGTGCGASTGGTFTYVSPVCETAGLCGRGADGAVVIAHSGPSDVPMAADARPLVGQGRRPSAVTMPIRLRRSDGTEFVGEVRLPQSPVRTAESLRSRGSRETFPERAAIDGALRESESRYRQRCSSAAGQPVAEDFSLIKQRIDELREAGVADFAAYLQDDPMRVAELPSLCASSTSTR